MLRLRSDCEIPIVICLRQQGQVISDDACEDDYEALQSGVYRRFMSTCAGEAKPVWLFLCKSDDLGACLAPEIDPLTHYERKALALDAAWQSVLWKERLARRTRGTAAAS